MATTERLDAAGFVDIECWLTDEPTRFEAGEPFETYLRTVVLGAHLERLPADEHDAFVHAVAERVGEPVIEYVRLNIVARRSAQSRTVNAGPWPGDDDVDLGQDARPAGFDGRLVVAERVDLRASGLPSTTGGSSRRPRRRLAR